jgi:hypothetical protein
MMTLLLGAELPDRRMRGRAAEPTIRTFVRTRRVLSDSLCAGPRGHRGLVNGTAGVLRGAGGESREGAEWSVRGEERCGVCGGSGPVGSLGDRDSAYDGGAGARFAPDIQRAADRVQPVGHALQACPVCRRGGILEETTPLGERVELGQVLGESPIRTAISSRRLWRPWPASS